LGFKGDSFDFKSAPFNFKGESSDFKSAPFDFNGESFNSKGGPFDFKGAPFSFKGESCKSDDLPSNIKASYIRIKGSAIQCTGLMGLFQNPVGFGTASNQHNNPKFLNLLHNFVASHTKKVIYYD
jgi:hypothetical protein